MFEISLQKINIVLVGTFGGLTKVVLEEKTAFIISEVILFGNAKRWLL